MCSTLCLDFQECKPSMTYILESDVFVSANTTYLYLASSVI